MLRAASILSTLLLLVVLGSTPALAADRTTVLVVSFENHTSDRNIEWIGEGLATLIIERLNAEPGLYVFGRDERVEGLARFNIPETMLLSRATTLKLAWDMGADIAILGSFSGTSENLLIDAQILNISQSSLGEKVRVQGRLDELMTLGAALSGSLAKVLVPGSSVPESDFVSRPPIPRSAFEAYIRGVLVPDPLRTIEFYSDAIRLNPQYGAALYQLGRMHFQNTDYRLSASLRERVPVGALEYPHAQFLRGVCYYRMGEFSRAIEVFSALPAVYDTLLNLGAAQARSGDPAAALNSWIAASRRDPHGPEAVFNAAWLQLVAGAPEIAQTGFEQFLQRQGRDAEALFGLSAAFEKLGRTELAQSTAAQAVRLSPRIERWLHQPLPDLLRLRTEFDRTELRLPPSETLWTAARLRRRAAGQDVSELLETIGAQVDSQPYGEVLRELEDVSRTFPESPDVPLLMGRVYERRGQYDQAMLRYEQALQMKPSVEIYLMLARLLRTMNQPAEAVRAIDRALKLEPGNPAALSLRSEIQRPPPTTPRRGR